ncbi:MAG TPA: MFS transporter [Anaerolineaceae bacterium]|nr:MFS transporter [Anaerolineaceae bacterium]
MTRDLLLVMISLFAWGTGEGLFVYFQPLYLQQWGADPVLIGKVFGGMGIAMAISQIPTGYLSDRFGPRRIMWLSWGLGAVAAVAMAAANSLTTFIVGLLLYGLTAFALAPMNAYITRVRGGLGAGRALTYASAAYNFGAVIGPTVGGVVAGNLGLRTVYWIAAVAFVISTLLVLFVRNAPPEHHSEQHIKGRLHRHPRFVMLVVLSLITMFSLYLAQPLTPNYLQNERGLTIEQIGWMGSAASLGNTVIMLVLGGLAPMAGFLVGLPLVALFAIIMWRGDGLWVYALGYFLMGGYRLSRSMVLAVARTLIHPAETGLAYGALETTNALALILAPPLAGYLYAGNPQWVYQVALLAIGTVLLLNIVVWLLAAGRRARP